MRKHNPNNERMKRKFFSYLKEAKRQSEPTVDAVAKALNRFEVYTGFRDFKGFHIEQAIGFKKDLAQRNSQRSDKPLSKATLHSTFTHLKRFFQWLSSQPGYKSRLQYSDADYFNLSEKERRVATAHREQRVPTIEQVKHVISAMPAHTDIEKRNRALIAFTLLTGARDSAIASLKIKHVDLIENKVDQDAREVKTKFSKTFMTVFFPVGEEIRDIVRAWVLYLREHCLWGNEDPLFPATKVEVGAGHQFQASGLSHRHWSNATPIRAIFRKAFTEAGLPYFNPHSFRNSLARLGQETCRTPEEFKAWSQNLGHENPLTTFVSYGEVPYPRQAEILKALERPRTTTNLFADADAIAEAVARKLLLGGH